jgi:hypothetical protein
VPLFKKHVHWTKRPSEIDPSGILKACSLDADYPEIAGVFEPAVEEKLNAALLRFSAFNSQPHVIQALYADGFFVPYPKLAGVLSNPGPLDPLR